MSWPVAVKALYEWDNISNRGFNAIGDAAYDLTFRGSPTFSTSDIIGKAKWTAPTIGNGAIMPAALVSYLAGRSEYQIECYYQAAARAAVQYKWDMIFDADNTTVSMSACFNFTLNLNSPYNAGMLFYDGGVNEITLNPYPAENSWNHVSFEFSGGNTIKVYLNGVLKLTLNSIANPFNTYSAKTWRIGDSLQSNVGPFAMSGYLDRYLIRSTVTNGVPTVFTPDGGKGIYTFGMPKTRFKKQRLGAI